MSSYFVVIAWQGLMLAELLLTSNSCILMGMPWAS